MGWVAPGIAGTEVEAGPNEDHVHNWGVEVMKWLLKPRGIPRITEMRSGNLGRTKAKLEDPGKDRVERMCFIRTSEPTASHQRIHEAHHT